MLTRMAARSAVGTLCSFLSLLGSACTGDEVRLLEDDWRSQERLRRMDLVVEQWSGSDWVVVPTATTVDDIDDWVEDHCKVTLEQTPAFNDCDMTTTDPCDPWVCNAQRELCRALTFREMAEGVDDVVLRLWPSGTDGYLRLSTTYQARMPDAGVRVRWESIAA